MNSDVCRLCVKSDNSLIDVFKNNEHELWKKIYMCFGVKIKQEDFITKKICRSCYFFTNSAFEHRISSLANDAKLKREYEQFLTENLCPISQNDFLNTLNLTSKIDEINSKSTKNIHSSVQRLKRNYPNINIPLNCLRLDINPIIVLEHCPNKKHKPELGIWSITNKNLKGKQPDLILSRIKPNNDLKTNNRSSSSENESSLNTLSENSCNRSSPRNLKKPLYTTQKRSKKTTKVFKRIISPKVNDIDDCLLPKSVEEVVKTVEAQVDESRSEDQDDRSVLKTLLRSDEFLTQSLSKLSSNKESQPDEENSLLVPLGEELKTWICQTCNKVFDTQTLLKHHKKYNHKSSLRCSKCSKKFSVVESLVKHLATHKPDDNQSLVQHSATPDDNQSLVQQLASHNPDDNPVVDLPIASEENVVKNLDFAIKSVARKKTNGALFLPAKKPTISQEFVISSDEETNDTIDDDVMEITETPKSNPNTLNDFLDTALQPQKDSNAIDDQPSTSANFPANSNPLLLAALSSALRGPNDDTTKPTTNATETNQDNIFVIEDSDGEENPKTQEETVAESAGPSNVSKPQVTTENNTSNKVRHEIVVIPSEDKIIVEQPMSMNARITNELNYINYIFKKCSYGEKSQLDLNNKWTLQNIRQITDKSYIPVDIQKSSNNTLDISYTPTELTKTTTAPNLNNLWNVNNAITLPKPNSSSNILQTVSAPPEKAPTPTTTKPSKTQPRQYGRFIIKQIAAPPKQLIYTNDTQPLITSSMVLDQQQNQQPIVLNGMSYPFSKLRCNTGNTNGGTVVVQQIGQQTSVNIQNYIHVNELNMLTTTQNISETVSTNMPILLQQNDTETLLPKASNVDQQSTNTEAAKPMIRIKKLSELTDKNFETRNQLHNHYSHTLNTYVGTKVNNGQNSDEFLQIS